MQLLYNFLLILIFFDFKNSVQCNDSVNILLYLYLSISFSLVAVARTFRTMLNNSGETGHPCLIPDHRGNAFSFLPLRIMLAVGLSYMAFTVLR